MSDRADVLPARPEPEISLDRVEHLADGLDHPEGVAWGPDGYVYAGGEEGQIYRISLDGEVTELARTGGFILGVTLDGDGNVYACDMGHQDVRRISPEGEVEIYAEGTPERPMITPNFGAFDDDGNLYLADSGGWKEENGCVYRIEPGGETYVAGPQIRAFPNGLAFGPEQEYLYVALSVPPVVVRASVRADGSLADPEPVLQMPGTVPDGLAFDAEGNLYVACYEPSYVYRLGPEGTLNVWAGDWQATLLAAPTNLAFCGPNLEVAVTANLGRWHLSRIDAGVAGLPLSYPHVD